MSSYPLLKSIALSINFIVTKQQAFEAEINACIISLTGDVLLIQSFIDRGGKNPFYHDRVRLKKWIEESIEILKESL